jgi:hypothetical protein
MAGTVLALALATPAWAQRTLGFGNVDNTQLINTPVSVTDLTSPIAVPQTLQPHTFTLASLIPKISFPFASSLRGQSTFPTGANMPGKQYLSSFGFQKAKAIDP